jgi:HPr kinase/phosphorylase
LARQLIVSELFERNRERLQLTWVSGPMTRAICTTEHIVSPADLIGHLNLMHPERLQVIGAPEVAWALRHSPERCPPHGRRSTPRSRRRSSSPTAAGSIPACAPAAKLGHAAVDHADVIGFRHRHLRAFVSRQLAETGTLHGVFLDVLGMGVLITGDSGVGKSELGLELISRGHGLVADDVVEVSRIGSDTLEGRCPELLKDFLEVRGLGLLNIRTVFGETACRRKMRLKLIVHLQKPTPGVPEAARLPLDAQTETILGVPVRRVTLPVAAGRNLAVLLEAAVRATVLKLRGIDSMQEFLDRQEAALRADAGSNGNCQPEPGGLR